jgi:catechol 2,3-dioxygenase-like lactoylglutathione lyase family enzyme
LLAISVILESDACGGHLITGLKIQSCRQPEKRVESELLSVRSARKTDIRATGASGGPRLSFVQTKYGDNLMAKLRHIAIQVPDLEKAAAFYEGVFELKRVNKVDSPIGNAIALSDGIMNLTLLHFPEGTKGGKGGPDWAGLHHIGFVVDDEKMTAEKIEHLGGEFFMELPNYPGVDAEKKFKDPNGIVFDVAEHDWRQSHHG